MQRLVTAKGKEFYVDWCGQSTIDFALRFAVVGSDMQTILTTFMDPEETVELTHYIDDMGNRAEYHNFTVFRGVDLKPDKSIVVSLMTP